MKNAKILVNTSIHEALPISFLEALSYGTLIVSNQNPENLTSKFGVYIGQVLGDGFDSIGKYAQGIKYLIENDNIRLQLAEQAVQYIKEIHSISRFTKDMREVLFSAAKKD